MLHVCTLQLGFALVLLVTSSGRAYAADPAERYLTAASYLYEQLDYEQALEALAQAKRHTRGIADDVTIRMYEGLVLFDMGKREEAQAAFSAALLLNPDAPLPTRPSPKVAEEVERIRSDVRRELGRHIPPARTSPPAGTAAPAPAPAPAPVPAAATTAPAASVSAPLDSGGSSPAAWTTLAVGAGVAGAGAVLLALSQDRYHRLTGSASLDPATAAHLRDEGKSLQWAGNIGLGVGVIAAAVGGGLLVFRGGSSGQATLYATPGGLGLAGTWP